MTFSVIVQPAAGQFEATLIGSPEVRATAATRDGALAALETAIARRVDNGEMVAQQGLSDFFQQLAAYFVLVPNALEVGTYITLHPEMAQMLPSICADVRQSFGPQVELSLELYQDPEIDDRYLTLYVRKEIYEVDTLDRLEAISDRFNSKLEAIPGYLLLATDFSLPRGSHAV
jgi:hypothetical protein